MVSPEARESAEMWLTEVPIPNFEQTSQASPVIPTMSPLSNVQFSLMYWFVPTGRTLYPVQAGTRMTARGDQCRQATINVFSAA